MAYKTDRLILNSWNDKDFDDFFRLNQDPDVMQYYPSMFDRKKTIELIQMIKNKFTKYGFGFYTCRLKDTHEYIGSIGLNVPDFTAHFMPCVEIGWRVAKKYWRHGFALEAASKCLEIGFFEFNLKEIVAFTAKCNIPSTRVMQKLGMKSDPKDDFFHPNLPKDHPLSLHVLYKLNKETWLENVHLSNKKMLGIS